MHLLEIVFLILLSTNIAYIKNKKMRLSFHKGTQVLQLYKCFGGRLKAKRSFFVNVVFRIFYFCPCGFNSNLTHVVWYPSQFKDMSKFLFNFMIHLHMRDTCLFHHEIEQKFRRILHQVKIETIRTKGKSGRKLMDHKKKFP